MSTTPVIALKTNALTIQFGGLKAVSDVSIEIPKGMIFGLIGPNGAGKTTFFNLLTGVYSPTSGSVELAGQSLAGFRPFEITHRGMARTFQNIRLFKNLSVLENIQVALDQSPKTPDFGLFSSVFRTPLYRATQTDNLRQAKELLDVFALNDRADETSSDLSYGEQRRLEIARALATGAQVILLDEPAAGLNPNETQELMKTIRLVRDRYHITVVLIEHDMKLVMGICERIAVLDYGIKIAEGTPKEIQNHPRVIEAYLGKSGGKTDA